MGSPFWAGEPQGSNGGWIPPCRSWAGHPPFPSAMPSHISSDPERMGACQHHLSIVPQLSIVTAYRKGLVPREKHRDIFERARFSNFRDFLSRDIYMRNMLTETLNLASNRVLDGFQRMPIGTLEAGGQPESPMSVELVASLSPFTVRHPIRSHPFTNT